MQVDEADELLGTTYLNISVVAPRAVRVRNNLANLTGSANLALRGSLANPVLFGEVTTDPGGTIDYSGSTYTLDRAIVTFANPTRIEPLLDVVARTKINEYQVTLSVLGSIARPIDDARLRSAAPRLRCPVAARDRHPERALRALDVRRRGRRRAWRRRRCSTARRRRW